MADLIALLSSSPAWFIGTCVVFGLLVGSFLNVVIYRIPVILERQWREQCMELAAGSADAAPPVAPAARPAGGCATRPGTSCTSTPTWRWPWPSAISSPTVPSS